MTAVNIGPEKHCGCEHDTRQRKVSEGELDADTFRFKNDTDMNSIVETIGKSMAAQIGAKPENVKCKGIRIFFVDSESEMLMSSGLFVKGFSPEDWDDE